MTTTLVAKNISTETSKDEITTFFAFCGKIKNIDVTEGETLTATITYEEPKAYRTALLLNNSQFGPNRITIAPAGEAAAGATDYDSDDGTHAPSGQASETGEISQENKPRSRIVAEYLAHGYVIGDAAVTRALELDEKHGVSARFFNTLQSLDQKYNASDKARGAAATASQRGSGLWGGLSSYFEKASNTATGQKIVSFYTAGSRQAIDVHNEARRLADLKTQEAGGSAVKAAGLERVLGKDKPAAEADASATAGAQATGSTTGTQSATPAAATTAIPATQPVNEKKQE
jgi:hypothetical protein